MNKDEAIAHYEAALKEAFPRGATGDVFHHWNEARKAMAQNARELGLDYDTQSDPCLMENAQGDLERINLVQTGVGIGKLEQSQVEEMLRYEIDALEAKLAEYRAQPAQQQEPVAKVVSTAPERIWLDLGFDPEVEDEISFDDLFEATWSHDNATGNGIEYVRADLAPASKPWVGLTDKDKQIAFDDTQEGGGFWEFADAIEAKLKEKNT